MASFDAQECFDYAVENYEKACRYVVEMSGLARQSIPDFSVKTALMRFDLILQAVLFRQAITDGKFNPLEKEFIIKITDHADLMDYMQNMDPEYDDIYTWDVDKLLKGKRNFKRLAAVIEDGLYDICVKFSCVFGAVDAVTDFDYLLALTECMGAITAALSFIDGKSSKKEILAASEAASKLFSTYFLTAKSAVEDNI